MPCLRSLGSCSLQTYQSRYGDFLSARADWNHGCSFDVWFTTRSMMTRRPRLSASCRNVTKSPSVPRSRVDAVEVGDVVPVVPVGRRVDRVQPQARDSEPGQVVQPARQPREVTNAVVVGVLERLDVEAVDDGVLEPLISHCAIRSRQGPHATGHRSVRRWSTARWGTSARPGVLGHDPVLQLRLGAATGVDEDLLRVSCISRLGADA